ncbi:MAG TPA: hypothetical protein VFY78_09415 [Gammaproteobacteria bacterium]|nr:hypothetical protein [Gammaproteobacteria bacterium]
MINITQNLTRYRIRIARVLLVLFVMAWANLVFQAPLHAAMKMNNEMPEHCKPLFCDTVLGMQDQADDGLSANLPVMADIPVMFQLLPALVSTSQVGQQYQHARLAFLQTSPPPLTRSGVLRI